MSSDAENRIEAFKADLAEMKLGVGRPDTERRLEALGVLLMVAGVVVGIIAYIASLNVTVTHGSNIDVLNSNSYQILALIGIAVSVCGGLVFLRYALVRFLRVWLLRQIYESRVGTS